MAVTVDNELLDGGRLLPLVEDFYTIQGEGFHAGTPAYFKQYDYPVPKAPEKD